MSNNNTRTPLAEFHTEDLSHANICKMICEKFGELFIKESEIDHAIKRGVLELSDNGFVLHDFVDMCLYVSQEQRETVDIQALKKATQFLSGAEMKFWIFAMELKRQGRDILELDMYAVMEALNIDKQMYYRARRLCEENNLL